MDRRDRLVSKYMGTWREIKASDWNNIKDHVNKVVEIPNIPVTGLSETDQPISVLKLTSNSGDSFSGRLCLLFKKLHQH